MRTRRSHLRALLPLAAIVLVAGCGGSSGGQTGPVSSAGAAATAGSSTPTGQTGTSSGPTAPGAGGSPQLAFAKCMRANGVPNFPDPAPGGGFDVGAGVDQSSPAVQKAQAKCQRLMGGGPPGPGTTTHPSEPTLEKLRKIAVCMRAHGISEFPDPRTTVPADPASSGISEITDFDGVILLFPSTLNMEAPAYRQALAACGAPPLGLRH